MLACYVFVTGFILLQPDTARAQAAGQLSEKPIAIFYAKDMSQKRNYTYAMNLSKRMDFAESFRRHFPQSQDIEKTEPTAQDSVDGYLTYLVSGPIPRVKSLSFCSVADAAAAKSLFEAGFKKGGSESGKLIEMDNGGFIVERTEQFTRPLPEDADEAKIVRNGRVQLPARSSEIVDPGCRDQMQAAQAMVQRVALPQIATKRLRTLHSMALRPTSRS